MSTREERIAAVAALARRSPSAAFKLAYDTARSCAEIDAMEASIDAAVEAYVTAHSR